MKIMQSKTYSKQNDKSSNYSLMKIKESLSINFQSDNEREELNNIIKLIELETDSNITKFDVYLNYFIRKNSKIKNDIIEKILNFLSKKTIHYKSIIKCISTILELLIDNFQIITLLNKIIPILFINLFLEENLKNIEAIHDITKFIGKLIKIGNTHIFGLIEDLIDTIFHNIFNENSNESNLLYAFINLLNEIMKNSPSISFNNIIIKNNLGNFISLMEQNCCNKNDKIREMSVELTASFIGILKNRDKETKKKNIINLYDTVFNQYKSNVKINDNANNYYYVNGFILIIKKIYELYPALFNDESLYTKLADSLMKFRNCGKNEQNIKLEFINFIPTLYKMNSKVFVKRYFKEYMKFSNQSLNAEKDAKIIKYTILEVLGKLNYFEKEKINKYSSVVLLPLIEKLLEGKEFLNEHILKCLSDLLNNKEGVLSQSVILIININKILPRIFKTPFNPYKVEFVTSLINYFNYYSKENCTIVILCLNTISQVLCNEEFRLDNFLTFNENNSTGLILPNLIEIRANSNKDITKYLSDISFKDKTSSNYLEMVSSLLTLFSNIQNNLFYKDMLIFYYYKLIPMMKYSNKNINKQIINIAMCDFVNIDKDGENSSEFIIKNIIDALINIFILNKESLPREDLINIFENKKVITQVLLKDRNIFIKKIINLIDSSNNDNSKELLIKILSILEKYENNKITLYKNFTDNYVEGLLFEIYNTKNKLYQEKLIVSLLYITIYFKHLFLDIVYEKILNICILLILKYDFKDSVTINVLKIINELLSNENIKGKNIDLFTYILYILAAVYFKESGINDYLSEYMFKMLYLIIKKQEIDIFEPIIFDIKDFVLYHRNNLNYNELKLKGYYEKLIKLSKKLENISVTKLIYNYLLKGENDNNAILILKILGLSINFSIKYIENLNLYMEQSSEENKDKYILEDDQLKIRLFNKFTQGNTAITIHIIDYSGTKAVLSLMELIKYYNKKDLKIKIIQNMHFIIKSIPQNQPYYVDIILPTILQILPQYESKYQNILIKNLTLLISLFKIKSKRYLDEIVLLMNDYIEPPYLETVNNLFVLLLENYEYKIRRYYYRLIPKFTNIIKKEYPEKISYLKILILIINAGYINPYVKLILEDLKLLIINTKDLVFFDLLLDLLKEIVEKCEVYIYYPFIISILLRKINLSFKKAVIRRASRSENSLKSSIKNNQHPDINVTILNKFFEILDIMNNKYRNYFILFLPKITSYFIGNGLIDYSEFRQKLKKYINSENEYTFLNAEKYRKKISLEFCKINCFHAFNSFHQIKKRNTLIRTNTNINEFDKESNQDLPYEGVKGIKFSFSMKKLNMNLIKNRQSVINNNIVMKSLENSNCSLEKDWIEWYRKVNKSIFEQTPSKFIYIYYIITEYYFKMSFDFNLHSFLSVYENITDNNKTVLIEYLDKAVISQQTPDYIITATLNLIDFMEKKGINLSFRKNEELGEIAYNCKAYAKALYFKEKGYELSNTIENAASFIDLYYKLNVKENCIGLIKLCETNKKDYSTNDYDKNYIWYINMHDYNKALEIINEKMAQPVSSNEIKKLKNFRNICLYGLCDWETILSEENDENDWDENNLNIVIESNKERDNKIEDTSDTKEKVEKKILLLKSSLALGNWDKLFKYMKELKEIFLENEEKEYPNFENDIEKKGLNHMSNLKNKEINNKNDDYFSFNDLINKYEFQFLKSDDSIFDLNIFGIIMNLKTNNFDVARKYIENCQQLLLNKIKVLIKESYTRGNEAILKNQCLQQLENYCNYKQYHLNDKQYLEQMKSKFDLLNNNLSQNPDIYAQYIEVNSLIYPIEEEYYKYIDLSKIYRKSGLFVQAEKILKFLKKKLNIKDNYMEDKKMIFDEKRIKIELSYNKCLYENGNIDKAADNLTKLIELLKDNNLSQYNNLGNIMKSKIYGNYAFYKLNQLIINKFKTKINRQKSENINGIFSRNISNYLNKHNFLKPLPKKEESDKGKKILFKIDNKILLEHYINESYNKEKSDKRISFNLPYVTEQDKIADINHYLRLATEFNNKSYKYWHTYAMFNYKCYKYLYRQIKTRNQFTEREVAKINDYATNAIKGLRHSLLMAKKSRVRTLEDCLRFIDIFFELGNNNNDLLNLIESIINETEPEIFIGIIPQLTCRFDLKNEKVLNILINLLTKIFSIYPEVLFFPLISIKNSKTKKSREIANKIMENAFKKNYGLKELTEEYEEFVQELNKCAFLCHEEWLETIEACSKLYLNKEYDNMVNQFMKMYDKMKKQPENLYEINFYQYFWAELSEAKKKLNKYLLKKYVNYLKEAWEIFQTVYEKINNYTHFHTISLQYISSILFNFKDSNIIIPTFLNKYFYNIYENNLTKGVKDLKQNFKPVTIKQIDKYLNILDTKQHPRKISMMGTNNKEYIYLLKGHEDLRQDERVIQIMNLMNLIMSKEKTKSSMELLITVYSVIPLSNKSGLIGWVHDCNSLKKLIKDYRKMTNKIHNIEKEYINEMNPGYETSSLIYKIDTFKYILEKTKDKDLSQMIWLKAKNSESWFVRRTNYSRSLAVMSIVGYILGLGDRDPNNILMNQETGKIVHIDFSNCFEVSMKRDRFPEKVPFRLTRMLIKALGITGVEGIFRLTCEKTLLLMKNNRDSLLAILSALVHNPLISFRLLIPLILKKQKKSDSDKNLGKQESHLFDENNLINSIETNKEIPKKSKKKRLSDYSKEIKNNKKIKEDDFEGKEERQIMEREKRQIINLFEENEDIDIDELYKIAQLVLQRINNKLMGMHYKRGEQLNEKEQVNFLIKQATSIENLASSYLGWMPYW